MKGILTAGGLSRRMGQKKAWLEWGGQPMILHLHRLLTAVCEDVVVVANDPDDERRLRESGLRTVRDVYAGQGPLAGLHAGLSAGFPALREEEAVCLVGCDLPFLRGEVLQDLERELMLDAKVQAAVPRLSDKIHPVCAVYRADVREIAAALLQNEENRMRRFLEAVRTKYVEADEWERYAPSPFANVNTPDDYREACILWKKEGF